MVREKNPAIGSSWDDLQKTIFTKEEIAEVNSVSH